MIQVGFTYIGTIVGAGFASGQEIFQFITRFGSKSTIIIAISIFLFTLAGAKVMLLAQKIEASSYHQFNHYMFGERIGNWVNGFMLVTLICITGVMLAGTGALFEQQFGRFYQIGILVTAMFVYIVTSRGIGAVMTVNSFVVPLMISFTGLIGAHTFLAENYFSDSPTVSTTPLWILSPFLYVAFNISLALVVLVPIGGEIRDRNVLIGGSIIGGAGLGLLLLLSNYTLLVHSEEVSGAEVPMAMVVSSFGPLVQWMFSAIILAEIFTTLVGNVFGVTRQLQVHSAFGKDRRFIIIGLLAICYVISQFGFSSLVHRLYPLFGYIGAGTLLMIFIMGKNNKKTRDA
ncbi:hypothetical protein P4S83_09815 [Aneurinibacillus thermoaerophilus]|uniref:YkvI family membrane protein n=1 Tax=Aneurinibacillus thermoaerophilus TaxID=143495 RepID=UPI002E1E7F94|nr:hypothetical protein [Aneurinibacillus thermoaerophilus]MED0763926.1 hypothetical protein [Aneurinibacillus thermoaerophilus]